MVKPSTLYVYLVERIKDKTSDTLNPASVITIERGRFRALLGFFNIPHCIQTRVIQEMQQQGLILIKNKQKIDLLQPKD